MRRREVIALLGGTAVGWPRTAHGQEPAMPVIGFMTARSPGEAAVHTAAFLRGLKETGYIAGLNVAVEYRWAEGHYDRLPALAAELVRRQVAVIAAVGGPASAVAAKAATSTIPVVFIIGGDPVRLGLVASFNRPGGNATGVSLVTGELGSKRLELLCELVCKLAPSPNVVALLLNPTNPDAEAHAQDVRTAANALGRQLLVVRASSEAEFEKNFAMLAEARASALVVQNDPFFDTRRDQLVALAARHAVPAIYHIREFPQAGGLMSYGPSLADAYYLCGVHIGRVLKGASPSDLPVAQPTRFELVVNAKTMKELGLDMPDSLLARADEVIA